MLKFLCLIFLTASPSTKCDEIADVFLRNFGLMGRSVWNTYQVEGQLDLKSFTRDCLAQEFGFIDAYQFSEIVSQLNHDPIDILEEYLGENDARKQAFALNAIIILHDRRLLNKVQKLITSQVPITRELHRLKFDQASDDPFASTDQKPSPETIGELAGVVVEHLKKPAKDAAMVASDQPWLLKAQTAKIPPPGK